MAERPSAKKLAIQHSIESIFGKQSALAEGRDLDREKHLLAAINKPAFNNALSQLIASRNLSHSLPEWPDLYALLHSVNYMSTDILVQCRGQVPKLLDQSFLLHRSAVISKLLSALTDIHWSVDLWSSPSHTYLQAVVAHFVDAKTGSVKKALLSLRELHGTHSVEAQVEIFLQVIKEYGVEHKIGYFTLDNAYNNDTMLRVIARALPDFHPEQRRLRCNGHIINLAVQAFLFGKNKDASDEAIRQIAKLSKEEPKGGRERIQTAAEWRTLGALGMLHNIVVYIRPSDLRDQAFLRLAGRIIPRDNSTRWNSWYMMLHVAIKLRRHVNNFIDEYYNDDLTLKEDLLTEHWQELQEICDFLEPFYDITKDTQWDDSTLDEVLSNMDFLVTHYDETKAQYTEQGNIRMVNRLLVSWYKFDDYYKLTDDAPVYATALLLHPSLREH